MNSKKDKEQIEAAIKEKRELMIASAKANGFTNEITLKYSQELDVLINEYQRFFRKKEIGSVGTVQYYGEKFRNSILSKTLYA